MFDRLVCMNGGNPREDLIDHKNPELADGARAFARVEGALAASTSKDAPRRSSATATAAVTSSTRRGGPSAFEAEGHLHPGARAGNDRRLYAPLVWQCRYSGIEVPDALWHFTLFGRGRKYSDNQAEDMTRESVYGEFDAWTDRFAAFVGAKGKIEPGRYRAYGYEAPPHRWADWKLKWRELRMGTGHPPEGSSPAKQQASNLNRDATLHPKRSEGEKLRKEEKTPSGD